MDRSRLLIWVLAGWVIAEVYVYMTSNSVNETGLIMIEKYQRAIDSGPEARDWLKRNKHPAS